MDRNLFNRVAQRAAEGAGSPYASLTIISLIIIWAASGPFLKFSDTWQLLINTGSAIITLLMVFLIQASQNRDARAMQFKLDELIRSSNARNQLVGLEHLTEEQFDSLKRDFERELHVRSTRAERPKGHAH
jgi:low affinity Fe/Cu permease